MGFTGSNSLDFLTANIGKFLALFIRGRKQQESTKKQENQGFFIKLHL